MKTTKILVMALIALFVVSIVFAAKEDVATETQGQAKNMTYGKCVSDGAKQKNACYNAGKEAEKTCKTNAGEDKSAIKKCSQDAKKAKSDCKSAFKSSKNECKKIKHNFFETIGSSMK